MSLTQAIGVDKQAREIQYFLYSQAFADGFRATLAILLPALVSSYLGYFDIGLTISLGAMCVSLTDAPGPLLHRRNGMLFCSAFIFLIALLTALARINLITLGIEIAAVSFFFSMFTVYGNRATSVGNAAILVMILTMDKPLPPADMLPHALYIMGGGLYYLVFSLLLHTLRPYRIAQRALGDCIREMAAYLAIKGDFYNGHTDLAENYRRMVNQQIVVNEKQDAVRELFFKTRQIVEESTREGRRLVFTFVKTVDVFEDITASYYDYALLRQSFQHTGVLEEISRTIKGLSGELDAIGIAIQGNTGFTRGFDYDEELRHLKASVDAVAPKGSAQTLVLRKILVNLRKMLAGLQEITQYFERDLQPGHTRVDHSHFVSHQSLDPKLFGDNLTFRSSIFRHALRVCIACMAGYVAIKLIGYGHHSYWIIMTIAFMMKPAFSLTKQRNVERILGTLIGGLIGVLVLVFITNKTALFVVMVLFMIGTYSFMRIRYLVMVICTTPYVLILFSILGTHFRDVAQERLFDTVLGCAIAFSASYFLFPNWESDQLRSHMQGIIRANANYLYRIVEALSGLPVNMLEYKLARKDVYLHSANLSAAFQRMLSEPKSKQRSEKDVHQFVVLNHILFSNTATLVTTLLAREKQVYPEELVQLARKALLSLNESSKKFGPDGDMHFPEIPASNTTAGPLNSDDLLIKEQLAFLNKLCADINRTIAEYLKDVSTGRIQA